MGDQLEAYLAERGLGQYQSILEENDIDVAVLTELSDTDLKDMGITSLGHRRKLLAAVTNPPAEVEAQPAPPTNEPPPQQSKTEEVLYERRIDVWAPDFSGVYEADVRITNRRVVLGSKTYALQNIDVVSVGDNSEAVAAMNLAEAGTAVWGYGAILLGIGAFWLHWILAAILLGIGWLILSNQTSYDVSYSVRIGSSADGDAFFTHEQSDAVEIVDALNEAIVSLSM